MALETEAVITQPPVGDVTPAASRLTDMSLEDARKLFQSGSQSSTSDNATPQARTPDQIVDHVTRQELPPLQIVDGQQLPVPLAGETAGGGSPDSLLKMVDGSRAADISSRSADTKLTQTLDSTATIATTAVDSKTTASSAGAEQTKAPESKVVSPAAQPSERPSDARATPEVIPFGDGTYGKAPIEHRDLIPHPTEQTGKPNQSDRSEVDAEHSEASSAEVHAEHQKLDNWAQTNLTSEGLEAFRHDMTTFEQRLGPDHAQVLETYKQVERITEAQGEKPLTSDDRAGLAATVMHYSAVPTDVRQGDYNTCTVASMEARTYMRSPADAARLVADVSLTGHYRAADDTEVKVDPTPHGDSKAELTVPPSTRPHAGEIFETTAMNIYWAKFNNQQQTNLHYLTEDPTFPKTPGDNADTGERVEDYSTRPAKLVLKGLPGLGAADAATVSAAITGKDVDRVLVSESELRDEKRQDRVPFLLPESQSRQIDIKDENALRSELQKLKDEHKLPVGVAVNPNSEPFHTDSGAAFAAGDGVSPMKHVVTITDYDPKSGHVLVANQWGPEADHGKDNPIPVHQLLTAMQSDQDAARTVAQDVASNQRAGIVDIAGEMDFLRHAKMTEQVSEDKYEDAMLAESKKAKETWNTLSESQRTAINDQLEHFKLMRADYYYHQQYPNKDQ